MDSPSEIAAFFKVKPTELAQVEQRRSRRQAGQQHGAAAVGAATTSTRTKAALVDPARVRVVTVGSAEFFDLVEARARAQAAHATSSRRATTCKRIGKKFNLTVADLERINRFGAAHTDLVVGQKLTVYVPMSAGGEGQGRLRADARAGWRRPPRTKSAEPRRRRRSARRERDRHPSAPAARPAADDAATQRSARCRVRRRPTAARDRAQHWLNQFRSRLRAMRKTPVTLGILSMVFGGLIALYAGVRPRVLDASRARS